MKILFALVWMMSAAWSSPQPIDNFDQMKLADFISRLPSTVKAEKIDRIEGPRTGRKVQSIFPAEAGYPFSINCELSYYNSSSIMSTGKCQLDVDFTSLAIQKKYDEGMVVIKDQELVNAIREAIVDGNSRKEFRAVTGKKMGTTLSGKWAWIFSYYFSCSIQECRMIFGQME